MPDATMSDPPSQAGARLDLAEHLPHLIRRVYAQLDAASAGPLAQFGVNGAVWRILAVLWQHGDLTHRQLSELASIEVSTLSRVSKAVQSEGLIRRHRTDADQRTVRISLTDEGRELVQQLIPSALRMQDQIAGCLPCDDVESLIRILHVVARNLNDHSEWRFDAR